MTVPRSVADVLADPLCSRWRASTGCFFNIYVPGMQYPAKLVTYVHRQLELRSAWTAPLASISEGFTTALLGSPGGRFR